MVTVLIDNEVREAKGGRGSGGALWLPAREAEAVAGVAAGPAGEVDVAAQWRRMGRPVASDEAGGVWALGAGHEERAAALRSLRAPDFTLPDLDGRPRSLSEFRGRKVFLASWASW